MRPYKILGISGRLGAGKDTLADSLIRSSPQTMPGRVVRKYAFATPLKEACIDLLGLERRQVHGTQADKNEKAWFGRSGRECMEEVGDGLSYLNPTWAADLLLRKVGEQMPYLGIVIDVRHEAELLKLQDAGGKIVRLTRDPEHRDTEIERELDGFAGFDSVIDNSVMTKEETYIKVLVLLHKWGWAQIEGV